jgi:hypothetical protein
MARDWSFEEQDRSSETGANVRDVHEDQHGRHNASRDRAANEDRSSRPNDQERSQTENSERTYYLRDRSYVLRESEFSTLTEIGKFRVIDVGDLAQFAYGSDEIRMARDLRHLEQHALLVRKTLSHESKRSQSLVTLTKKGKRLLIASGRVPEGQALYHGVVKPRELKHDAALYRLYERELSRISQTGGRVVRVVLDYELKRHVHRDLARLEQQPPSQEARRQVAERHGLTVISNKIQISDLRVEYETADRERRQLDLELATRNYRPRALAQKVKAGFSLYAPREDASKLRRVLGEAELTARIFAL